MSVPSSQLRQEMGVDHFGSASTSVDFSCLNSLSVWKGGCETFIPEHRAPVSVAIEALLTQCHLESGMVQDVSARLALRSGLAPQWADFGVRLWRVALKGHKLDVQVVQSIHSNVDSAISGGVTQTVDAILGPFRD